MIALWLCETLIKLTSKLTLKPGCSETKRPGTTKERPLTIVFPTASVRFVFGMVGMVKLVGWA